MQRTFCNEHFATNILAANILKTKNLHTNTMHPNILQTSISQTITCPVHQYLALGLSSRSHGLHPAATAHAALICTPATSDSALRGHNAMLFSPAEHCVLLPRPTCLAWPFVLDLRPPLQRVAYSPRAQRGARRIKYLYTYLSIVYFRISGL